jgi:spore germination cell wall hydrolase CwlJ-like protein
MTMPKAKVPIDQSLWDEVQEARAQDVAHLAKLLWGENSIDLEEPEALAMGDTVLNRMGHTSYPSSVKDVILQPRQYSPFNAEDPNFSRVQEFDTGHPMWEKYRGLAEKIMDPARERSGYTHYFTGKVPYWAEDMDELIEIGRHRFGKERKEARRRPAGGGGVKVAGGK